MDKIKQEDQEVKKQDGSEASPALRAKIRSACRATCWFFSCESLEEAETQYEQHMNAARWDVLALDDVRAVKNEYFALRRVLLSLTAQPSSMEGV